VYRDELYTLSGDDEFHPSSSFHDRQMPLACTAASTGFNFSGSNHFNTGDLHNYTHDDVGSFGEGSVASTTRFYHI